MAWDQKHYDGMKYIIGHMISHKPWFLPEMGADEWIKSFVPMIVEREKVEDYEGAKAIKDAIREVLNEGVPGLVPEEAKIRL